MAFTPVAYLKQDCPFSFKFLLFVMEAGLLDKIEVEELMQGEKRMEELRSLLREKLGEASFPCVQIEKGTYMSETDDLITYFAGKHGKSVESLEVVPFFERGVLKKLGRLYMENKKYKEKYGEL